MHVYQQQYYQSIIIWSMTHRGLGVLYDYLYHDHLSVHIRSVESKSYEKLLFDKSLNASPYDDILEVSLS